MRKQAIISSLLSNFEQILIIYKGKGDTMITTSKTIAVNQPHQPQETKDSRSQDIRLLLSPKLIIELLQKRYYERSTYQALCNYEHTKYKFYIPVQSMRYHLKKAITEKKVFNIPLILNENEKVFFDDIVSLLRTSKADKKSQKKSQDTPSCEHQESSEN